MMAESAIVIPKTHIEILNELDSQLGKHFENVIKLDHRLTRKLVSFQANKDRPIYRWYKYKEAFSANLVEFLLSSYSIPKGKLLDPFAGAGTTLFAGSDLGHNADGIELLPIGQQIIECRKFISSEVSEGTKDVLKQWASSSPWLKSRISKPINHLRITQGAYATETENSIGRFLAKIEEEEQNNSNLLRFALLCILESISFTRKDGQFLRWDYRSGRRKGANTFDKGNIPSFGEAISQKLNEIIIDIDTYRMPDLFEKPIPLKGNVELKKGSCLEILPELGNDSYNVIITSPPYCNRYDYTRTYALEHALLGITETEQAALRQQMLSCTVESRAKSLSNINRDWSKAISICDNQPLLQKILEYLDSQKQDKKLNNNGIPRMVKGYFYEMACVIQECFRILKKNSLVFMVNDNVRYAGASISVDLILSSVAESLGFKIENILVLPQGKGNSSQQMGKHGREALRKCIYVWRKES